MQSNRDRSDKPPAYPITDQTTAADIKTYGNVAAPNSRKSGNDRTSGALMLHQY